MFAEQYDSIPATCMLYFNMPTELCSLQHLFGNGTYRKAAKSQVQVKGTGTGTPEPRIWCHIGQDVSQACSLLLHVAVRLPVKETASAIKPDSDAAHRASAKEDAVKSDMSCTQCQPLNRTDLKITLDHTVKPPIFSNLFFKTAKKVVMFSFDFLHII